MPEHGDGDGDGHDGDGDGDDGDHDDDDGDHDDDDPTYVSIDDCCCTLLPHARLLIVFGFMSDKTSYHNFGDCESNQNKGYDY